LKSENIETVEGFTKLNKQVDTLNYEIQRRQQVINDKSVKIEELTTSKESEKMMLKEINLLREKINKCPKCVGYREQITQLDKSNGEYKSKLAANRLKLEIKSLDKTISQTENFIRQNTTQNPKLMQSDEKLQVKDKDIQRLHCVIINLKNDLQNEQTKSKKLRTDLWQMEKEESETQKQNSIDEWYSNRKSVKKLQITNNHADKTSIFVKTEENEHCTETAGWQMVDNSPENRSTGLKRPRAEK